MLAVADTATCLEHWSSSSSSCVTKQSKRCRKVAAGQFGLENSEVDQRPEIQSSKNGKASHGKKFAGYAGYQDCQDRVISSSGFHGFYLLPSTSINFHLLPSASVRFSPFDPGNFQVKALWQAASNTTSSCHHLSQCDFACRSSDSNRNGHAMSDIPQTVGASTLYELLSDNRHVT